eukprot:jgi/Botrbrau1/6539/Bobra.40_2s0010.1
MARTCFTSFEDVVVHIHFACRGTFATALAGGPRDWGAAPALPPKRLLKWTRELRRCRRCPRPAAAEDPCGWPLGPPQCHDCSNMADLSFYEGKVAGLGPDPLRQDADKERLWTAMSSSKRPVGLILMDQSSVAGPGPGGMCTITPHVADAKHQLQSGTLRGARRTPAQTVMLSVPHSAKHVVLSVPHSAKHVVPLGTSFCQTCNAVRTSFCQTCSALSTSFCQTVKVQSTPECQTYGVWMEGTDHPIDVSFLPSVHLSQADSLRPATGGGSAAQPPPARRHLEPPPPVRCSSRTAPQRETRLFLPDDRGSAEGHLAVSCTPAGRQEARTGGPPGGSSCSSQIRQHVRHRALDNHGVRTHRVPNGSPKMLLVPPDKVPAGQKRRGRTPANPTGGPGTLTGYCQGL